MGHALLVVGTVIGFNHRCAVVARRSGRCWRTGRRVNGIILPATFTTRVPYAFCAVADSS